MKPENQTPASALMFAAGAHYGIAQKRTYTGEDYIVHPEQVSNLVACVDGATQPMIMAAALHDVVEDTEVSLATILKIFGPEVASLVEMVTDVAKPEDGNRAARRAIDLAHSSLASPQGKTIKLADVICNLSNLVKTVPRDFATLYLTEKQALLEVLREGDSRLHRIATNLVHDGLSELKETQ